MFGFISGLLKMAFNLEAPSNPLVSLSATSYVKGRELLVCVPAQRVTAAAVKDAFAFLLLDCC